MPTPGEHKTFHARILAYAESIGWTVVSCEEAEQLRWFDPCLPDTAALATHFGKRTKSRLTEITQILETLKSLGQL